MDLNELKPTERVIEIVSPVTKEPIGIRISLLHFDDPRMRKVRRSIQDEKNRLESRGKYVKAEDQENHAYELTFASMTGWEWYSPTGDKNDLANWKGEVPAFNKIKVFEIFDQLPWFLDQIATEVSNLEAFFPR